MNWKFWRRRAEPMPAPGDPDWERALINRLALEHLQDQRRGRRWGNIFKLLILLYLLGILGFTLSRNAWNGLKTAKEHTALIQVKGTIAADGEAGADRVISALRDAFKAEHVKGVVLRINSPGGSPVQSGYINDEIRRLKEKYKKDKGHDLPVYAVAVDICASGAYYIAVAADKIYADKASLVGSIGVRMDGFGFEQAMKDLGVERRLLTAGANKGILDPFSPLPEAQRQFIQGVLNDLHQQFITAVKTGRGDRLKGGDELFSGLFWSGDQALALGLVDGLGTASSVARDVVGAETLIDYTKKKDLFESFADRLGTSVANGLLRVFTLLGGGSVR
ncbi:S49 family peptidase [uncultured Thiodictyon sp.]|uniref:S49 family peptidase n=1 Tax=uncultured Thiodictyon sp. TaxID=1846217 RepID=UPI0025CDC68C|nr:S49 family peptidase [uncultured Thiodictyon sp.]